VISSLPLSVLLTVLYAATGGYSLLRWASLGAGISGHHGDRVAELSHLVMSVAMIAMAWAYGGPAGNAAQIVLFTVLAGYFLTRLPVGRSGARLGGCPAPVPPADVPLDGVDGGRHAAADGRYARGLGGRHMHDMPMGGADSAGQDGQPPAPTPSWAVVVTVAMSVALLAAAAYWLRRAVRNSGTPRGPGAHRGGEAGGEARPAEPPRGRRGVLRAGCLPR